MDCIDKMLAEQAALLQAEHDQQERMKALVQRAYTLLDDINQPFRTVERSDVLKWLADAKKEMEL